MKKFETYRNKFNMTFAALTFAAALVLSFTSCKSEAEIKYVDRIIEKGKASFVASPRFTAESDEGKVNITISCQTEGAVIYYTTDGSLPTTESTKYTQSISITRNTNFQAIAVKEGMSNSPVSYAAYSVVNKIETQTQTEIQYQIKEIDKIYAATPVFAVTNTEDGVKLALSSETDGAAIYYTTDGSTPGTASSLYSSQIALTASSCIKAIAVKDGIENSPVSIANVTIKKITSSAGGAGDPLSIALSVSVPNKNKNGEDYSGTKSNTFVTVNVAVTSANNIKKVVYKKNGSLVAKKLLADSDAIAATEKSDNTKWTFDISATDETANGIYTIAAIDEAGREEAEQITIDQFDFTGPTRILVASGSYSDSKITMNWAEPIDADFDQVEITYTYNDGTSDVPAGQDVRVSKGTRETTFTGIETTASYYTFSFITQDFLGNKSDITKRYVNITGRAVPEDFVHVIGATVSGAIPNSSVFVADRTVIIPDMYVCDHEVTQSEYDAYCITKYLDEDCGIGDNFPIYNVCWYDTFVYCNLRSIAEGLTPVYKIEDETDPTKWPAILGDSTINKYCAPGSFEDYRIRIKWDAITLVGNTDTIITTANGYRIPTDAEWEYIARSGNNGIPAAQTDYAGSNTLNEVAWNSNNSKSKLHEVKGLKPISEELKIYDMSGNVREWCFDWNASVLSNTPVTGPTSRSFDGRVLRGGFWNGSINECKVFYRAGCEPYTTTNNIGFRVVRNAN